MPAAAAGRRRHSSPRGSTQKRQYPYRQCPSARLQPPPQPEPAHARQSPYVYPFQNYVDSFFFVTSILVVSLGITYSSFYARYEGDADFDAGRQALEVVIIVVLVSSTVVGAAYICRGYQKHGWQNARIAAREATRRGKRAVGQLTKTMGYSPGPSRSASALPTLEVMPSTDDVPAACAAD